MLNYYINVCIFIYILFQIVFHYRLLQDSDIVPCTIQWVLDIYLLYVCISVYLLIQLIIYPCHPFPFGNQKFVFYFCESIFVLQINSFVLFFGLYI